MATIYFNSKNHPYLSNFYECSFSYYNIRWNSSEHCYQAMKSNDPIEWRYIAVCETSTLAKKYGRTKITMRPDWEEVKIQIMYNICLEKFKQNPDLMKKLIETNDAELVEWTSWHDQIWGKCFCGHCNPEEGRNELGKILMRIRNENETSI